MVQGQGLRIGELARCAELSPSALRYYEKRGVLPRPRRLPNGYRLYSEEALANLRLVRHAQALGITLKDIRQLLELVRCRQRPCEHVHALLAARLRHVERTLHELEALRAQLKVVLKKTRPGRCPATDLCPS
jgi:DNA-binding transcriptional MerR regulator